MRKVLILNPYLSTLGGGEKHMAYLCKFIDIYYKGDVRIEILVFNTSIADVFSDDYTNIEKVESQFNLSLGNTYVKKLDLGIPGFYIEEENPDDNIFKKRKRWHQVEKASKKYDLFVSFMDQGLYRGRAKKNIYLCMFPPGRLGQNVIKYPLRSIILRMYNHMYHGSYDMYVCNSQYTNKWYKKYWGEKKKNCVVYPPVFSRSEISGRYDENKKENIILSVGRFFVGSHSKRQLETTLFYLEHQEELKDYEYHLAGAVAQTKEDIEYLKKIKRLSKLSDKIFIHENCSYSELVSLYTKAKIFWHATGFGIEEEQYPSRMEHFGITTAEAMSYGVVPVVINKGGQPEVVKDGVSGFLWDTQEECISHTVKLMHDEALRKKTAAESVEYAEAFTIETFYDGFEKVFKELKL